MPSSNLRDAVHKEHCKSADSHDVFEAPNYGTFTTPATEYWFVVEPKKGVSELGITSYPVETKLEVSRQRKPMPLSAFEPELQRINTKLKRLGSSVPRQPELDQTHACMCCCHPSGCRHPMPIPR